MTQKKHLAVKIKLMYELSLALVGRVSKAKSSVIKKKRRNLARTEKSKDIRLQIVSKKK